MHDSYLVPRNHTFSLFMTCSRLPTSCGDVELTPGNSPSGNHPRPVVVGLLGHSYVSRLPVENHVVYPPGFVLRSLAAPGATLDNIKDKRAWTEFLIHRPAITVLVLGGNDIVTGVVTQELANKIKDLVSQIESETNGRCLVLGIESRAAPLGISVENYNKVKNAVNALLKRKHRRLGGRFNPFSFGSEYLHVDGVHLTPEGSRLLLEQILHMIRDHLSNFK